MRTMSWLLSQERRSRQKANGVVVWSDARFNGQLIGIKCFKMHGAEDGMVNLLSSYVKLKLSP